MTFSRLHWIALIVLVALLGGGWIAYSQEDVTEYTAITGLTAGPQAGFLAPDFTLQTPLGEVVTLSEYQGKPVVINFWATWCPPCRAEMPHIQEASVYFGEEVAFLGVNQGESAGIVAPFVAEFGLTFPILVDETSMVNRDYGVRALPTTIFVDKQGVIQEVFTGTLNEAILRNRLDPLIR